MNEVIDNAYIRILIIINKVLIGYIIWTYRQTKIMIIDNAYMAVWDYLLCCIIIWEWNALLKRRIKNLGTSHKSYIPIIESNLYCTIGILSLSKLILTYSYRPSYLQLPYTYLVFHFWNHLKLRMGKVIEGGRITTFYNESCQLFLNSKNI